MQSRMRRWQRPGAHWVMGPVTPSGPTRPTDRLHILILIAFFVKKCKWVKNENEGGVKEKGQGHHRKLAPLSPFLQRSAGQRESTGSAQLWSWQHQGGAASGSGAHRAPRSLAPPSASPHRGLEA